MSELWKQKGIGIFVIIFVSVVSSTRRAKTQTNNISMYRGYFVISHSSYIHPVIPTDDRKI